MSRKMDIVQAALAGSVERVSNALKAEVDVDASDEVRWMDSSDVCIHVKVVEQLLAAGAQPDHQNNNGKSALMWACYLGHAVVVEALLKGGATVDMQTEQGSTALVLASQQGHEMVVEALLNEGATVDMPTKDGWTALMSASKRGHAKVVEQLLEAGAQPDRQKIDGGTALSLARSYGHRVVVELLCRISTEHQKKAPRITVQPKVERSLLGTTVTFCVETKGEAPFHFSWLHDGNIVDCAEGPVLTLKGVGLTDSGRYQCQVEDKVGKVVSQPAELRVATVEYSDLQFLGDKPLGEGGSGIVWKGKWKPGGNLVAIKKVMELISREVEILQQLKHSNVIQLHGVVSDPRGLGHFIVTEYAENGSIHDYIHVRKKNPSLEQGLLWAEQVARAMQYLHENNYIHRDLKPHNVLLSSDLIAKICDLGSARTLYHTTKQTTAVGTYAWMAPEMLERKSVSQSCDVYSYGILLWGIITHKVPFEDVFYIFLPVKVLEGERPPIPHSCESHLQHLMECCWQRNAENRPSFTEILTVLKDKDKVTILKLSSAAVKETIDLKPRIAQLMNLKTTKGVRVNIIKSIAPVWKVVGLLMDLDPEGQKVVSIEAEHKENGPDICCQEMFKLWLHSPEATWGNLIELLVIPPVVSLH